jgi:hypothetical protein
MRSDSIGQLSWSQDPRAMSKPAPAERITLDKLGSHVSRIIKSLLPLWVDHMNAVIPRMPFARKIAQYPANSVEVGRYLLLFQRRWEAEFGKMDDDGMDFSIMLVGDRHCVDINSTGAAAKWFFCRMLMHRLVAMDYRRAWQREQTCFVDVALKDLPEDVTDCSICMQRLGVPSPDGEIEMPIRVVACCGNYFGINCLKEWYKEFANDRCPICRQPMSLMFFERLCSDIQDMDHEFSSLKGETDSEEDIESGGTNSEDLEEGEIVEEMEYELVM